MLRGNTRVVIDRRRLLAVAMFSGMAVLSAGSSPALAKKATMCSTALCFDVNGNAAPPMVSVAPGMHHPIVAPIFWGDYWNSNPANHYSVVGMIQGTLNGPYLAGLGQYGLYGSTVGQLATARMVPTAPVKAGTPTNPSGVVGAINSMIGAGYVPPPAQYADMLYTVFLPPGQPSFVGGLNTTGTCDSTCGAAYNGRTYTLAWIVAASPFNVSGYSLIFQHELVEAVTQNVSLTNCVSTTDLSVLNQVADICNCPENQTTQLGVQYHAYWSQADGACVIPEGYSRIMSNSGTANSWTTINTGTVRQVYAGGYGLVATNTSDQLMKWSGSGTTWTTIGGSGAMYAVGNGVGVNTVILIKPDASQVLRYSGSGTTWSVIDSPASAVYAGAQLVASDFSGGSYKYDGTGTSWTFIGGTPTQFALTQNGGTFALGFDFNVWQENSPGSWSQVGSAAAELFPGFSTRLAMAKLAATSDSYFFQGGTSWLRQSSQGTAFAVGGDTTLWALDAWRSSVSKSNNTGATNPSFTQLGRGSIYRMIGAFNTNTVFAVGPPVY